MSGSRCSCSSIEDYVRAIPHVDDQAGGALIDRDRIVHLSAFRPDEGARSGEDDGGLPRLQQFSRRARRYRQAS